MTATRLNPRLSVGTVSVNIPSVAHGAKSGNCTASCAKAGYTALGVVGWTLGSGTRQNFLNVWQCYLSNATTVLMRVLNTHATDAASATATVYVLYEQK